MIMTSFATPAATPTAVRAATPTAVPAATSTPTRCRVPASHSPQTQPARRTKRLPPTAGNARGHVSVPWGKGGGEGGKGKERGVGQARGHASLPQARGLMEESMGRRAATSGQLRGDGGCMEGNGECVGREVKGLNI
eukprot:64781-Chlamydomonas_euryale.AAC.4